MRVTARHSVLIGLVVGVALIWIFSGCARVETNLKPTSGSPPPKISEKQKPTGFMHTVKWPGENLSLIAKWYTGSGGKWKALAKANPRLNPQSIRIGDKILIPHSLAKTEEPMPRRILPSSPSKSPRAKNPPPKKPSSADSVPSKKRVTEEVFYAPI